MKDVDHFCNKISDIISLKSICCGCQGKISGGGFPVYYYGCIYLGRGRDEDSEYVVIGEFGRGTGEREMSNQIKEDMMITAVKQIQVRCY